jgi:hypothetical protein
MHLVRSREPLGATEAILLARGFTTEMFTVLVRDGLATATPETCMLASGRSRLSGCCRTAGAGRMMAVGPASCARTPSMRILRQWAIQPGGVPTAVAPTRLAAFSQPRLLTVEALSRFDIASSRTAAIHRSTMTGKCRVLPNACQRRYWHRCNLTQSGHDMLVQTSTQGAPETSADPLLHLQS